MDPQYTIPQLDDRFLRLVKAFRGHHDDQNTNLLYYTNNAFYKTQSGDLADTRKFGKNYLKKFADLNIQYTCDFPKMRVPHKAADVQSRQRCSTIEKALLGTWRANDGEGLQNEWADDATLMSEAFAVTTPILQQGELQGVDIERYDPRFCYWELADQNGNHLHAFYCAKIMTKQEIRDRWGVEPESSTLSDELALTNDNSLYDVDGIDRFFVVWRWDKTHKVCWVGNKYLEPPHEHYMGYIPVDHCVPFPTPTDKYRFGKFYLEPLVPLQAELNEAVRQKANIVRKTGNPLLWVRGLIANQLDELKKAQQDGGGAIAFGHQGEAGLLAPSPTDVIDKYIEDLLETMMDISHFGKGAFGQSFGSNTSGDAVHMYFQPTTKHVNKQWIAWRNFYRSVNEKILRIYEDFSYPGQQFKLTTHPPVGTYAPSDEGTPPEQPKPGDPQGNQDVYSVTWSPDIIGGYYETEITTPTATPQDDQANKRLVMEMIMNNTIPRVLGYEWLGLDSEDVLALMADENNDPRIHPEKFQALMQGLGTGQPGEQPGNPVGGTPGNQPPPPNPTPVKPSGRKYPKMSAKAGG